MHSDGRARAGHRRRTRDRQGDRARARRRRRRRRDQLPPRRGRGAETVAEIETLGRRGAAYAASVDDPEACAAMVGTVLADFGAVDILVNNAGIASRGHNVADTDVAEIERVFRTHAFAAFVLCKSWSRRCASARAARRHRDDLVGRDQSHGRELGAVQHGQGRARGARDGARQGGAPQRHPRERRRARPRRHRDGPPAREGRDGRRRHPHDGRAARSATCARPRRSPTSSAPSSATPARYLTGIKITVDGGTF